MKVENVKHDNFDTEHTCFVLSISQFTGEIKQLNFYNYEIATNLKGWGAVGIWRQKIEHEDTEYLDYLNEMSSDWNRGIGYM